MNNRGARLTIRFISAAMFLSISTAASAQSEMQCQNGRGSFKIAMVGSRGEVQSSGRPLLTCVPESPDFVAEDSKQLLAKIKLAKAQGDSSKAITKMFAARQKTLADKRETAINQERQKAGESGALKDAELRSVYLTPEMRALRAEYAQALRSLLTPEQMTQFDTNQAALAAKDAKGP